MKITVKAVTVALMATVAIVSQVQGALTDMEMNASKSQTIYHIIAPLTDVLLIFTWSYAKYLQFCGMQLSCQ
jgi:hypothetical protein